MSELVLNLMERLKKLMWMFPFTSKRHGSKENITNHFSMRELVLDLMQRLPDACPLFSILGNGWLDLRVAPTTAILPHQDEVGQVEAERALQAAMLTLRTIGFDFRRFEPDNHASWSAGNPFFNCLSLDMDFWTGLSLRSSSYLNYFTNFIPMTSVVSKWNSELHGSPLCF